MSAVVSRMVGVVCLRRAVSGRWGGTAIAPHSVLSDAPAIAVGASLGAAPAGDMVYFGAAELAFWTGETGHYRDNLVTGEPKLWVALTPQGEANAYAVSLVTANPYEGESLAGSPDVILEGVPMPADIAAELAAFVAERHVEQVFVKRKRDGGKGRRERRDGPG